MPEAARPLRVVPDEPEIDGEGKPVAAAFFDFLRRRLAGEYPVDDFGFDPDLTESVLLPVLRPLYHRWFRTEVTGARNLPSTGGALLVARKTGSTLACDPDAERLLAAGELVGVFPEGFKGIGKPFTERYKLQRFGRGGFVTTALKAGVPIIAVSVVGSEEIHPVIGNAKLLARVFNVPYFPLTPTFPWFGPLGLIPLPSKWHIEFSEPIETASYGPEAADDPMLVFELTDRVRETIQGTLYKLLARRSSIWR
jgi:1-acyl-sn-glycerol-3-phosphate acyltransferase